MSGRIPGADVMTAFANAVDDGVSSYKMAIFYLGVAAGQCFTNGWSQQDLEKELSNLELSHPMFANKVRAELLAVVGGEKL